MHWSQRLNSKTAMSQIAIARALSIIGGKSAQPV